MGQPDVYAGLSLNGLEASVSKLIALMGYSAESSKNFEGGLLFNAVKPDPLGEVRTVVYALSGRRLSQAGVKRVLESASGLKPSKFVFIALSGVSPGASAFALKHGMEVFDGKGFVGLLGRYGVSAPSGEKIFEFAFGLGFTLSEARAFFERRRGRKFLCFGVEETVVEIAGRYAPVGSFVVSREEEVKTGLFKTLKKVSKSNVFYVNLGTSEMYYARTGLRGTPNIGSSGILGRVVNLSMKSLRMLSDILKKGEVSVADLNQQHELFYQENMDEFRILLEEGLIAPAPGGEGFMPNLTLPPFDSPKYNIGKFTPVVKSVSSAFQVDEIRYGADDVAGLLGLFYGGRCEAREVVYMPYYTCVYRDDRGMKRPDLLLAPKYAT